MAFDGEGVRLRGKGEGFGHMGFIRFGCISHNHHRISASVSAGVVREQDTRHTLVQGTAVVSLDHCPNPRP